MSEMETFSSSRKMCDPKLRLSRTRQGPFQRERRNKETKVTRVWTDLETLEMGNREQWGSKIGWQNVRMVREGRVKILVNRPQTEILHHYCNCFIGGHKNKAIIF